MTYKQYYFQYKTDVNESADKKALSPYLPLLESILQKSGLYEKSTDTVHDPADIRRKLRAYILERFDDREFLIQMINEYLPSSTWYHRFANCVMMTSDQKERGVSS